MITGSSLRFISDKTLEEKGSGIIFKNTEGP
jgi:hypothetical protein